MEPNLSIRPEVNFSKALHEVFAILSAPGGAANSPPKCSTHVKVPPRGAHYESVVWSPKFFVFLDIEADPFESTYAARCSGPLRALTVKFPLVKFSRSCLWDTLLPIPFHFHVFNLFVDVSLHSPVGFFQNRPRLGSLVHEISVLFQCRVWAFLLAD